MRNSCKPTLKISRNENVDIAYGWLVVFFARLGFSHHFGSFFSVKYICNKIFLALFSHTRPMASAKSPKSKLFFDNNYFIILVNNKIIINDKI